MLSTEQLNFSAQLVLMPTRPHAGVGAAWKVAAVEPGSTVAVFGLGAVGLAVRTTNLLIALLRNTHFFVFVWTSLLQTHLSLAP